MTRRTGLLAMIFGTLAASSWLAYHHGGEPSSRRRARRFAAAVDPILRRAERESDLGATEYPAAWGPRRVA